jgi:hypothetical protein
MTGYDRRSTSAVFFAREAANALGKKGALSFTARQVSPKMNTAENCSGQFRPNV